MEHSVYKHWDKHGVLLYVGCCKNLKQRTTNHHGAHWFKDIANITHEIFPDKAAALAEEKRLIWDELPKYNRQHHPDNDILTRPLPEPPESMAKTSSGGYTIAYVRHLISKKCHDEAGSVRAFAKKKGASNSEISSVIRGAKKPTKRILKLAGLKKAIVKITPDKNPLEKVCYN